MSDVPLIFLFPVHSSTPSPSGCGSAHVAPPEPQSEEVRERFRRGKTWLGRGDEEGGESVFLKFGGCFHDAQSATFLERLVGLELHKLYGCGVWSGYSLVGVVDRSSQRWSTVERSTAAQSGGGTGFEVSMRSVW